MEKRTATYMTNRQAGLQEVRTGHHGTAEPTATSTFYPGH
jgi:hypothetical protein